MVGSSGKDRLRVLPATNMSSKGLISLVKLLSLRMTNPFDIAGLIIPINNTVCKCQFCLSRRLLTPRQQASFP